ncbi:MAG: S9 family peptidase [Caulobacterales bacterium]
MNRRDILRASAALPFMSFAPGCATTPMTNRPIPPAAEIRPVRIEQLGRVRVDPYQWLKDDNWQQVMRDPDVLRADIRAHLDAENAYMRAVMAPTDALQEQIFQEMKGRIKEDDATVPQGDGVWEYYSRYETGAQHPRYVRRPRGGGAEQLLLDVDAQARGKDFYEIGASAHSPDHALYAYSVDEQGSEYYEVRVRDLATGQDLPGPAVSTTGDLLFSPDSRYLFWIFRDDNGRPRRIFRRPSRGTAADDVLVYEEENEGFFINIGVTESREYILISCADHETSETRLIPARTPTAAPVVFQARQTGVLYDATHWDGRWIIRTNADGAVDFKLMTAPEGRTAKTHWRDFIPYQAGRFIVGVGAFENHLVRLERVDALPRIIIRARDGEEHAIEQAEEAYTLDLEGGFEFDTAVMRFVYTSPTTPRQTYDYDMTARTRTLRKTQEIPSGHDASLYECRRFSAPASDGAQVPITVLVKKGTPLDGSAPMMLYGYGSYGIPMDASFSIRTLSLVNRGWVYAIAHVRGGSERGFGWFLDGRKYKKKNTFSDFIVCAEELVRRNYSRTGNIVAYGGSAGGMLMGAIANMRPDLWAGVIGAVPFIDVLNTMSDTSLPLTPPEWPEWGNPIEDAEAYDYIASYSPYDNIDAKPYPAMLATGGLSDPRVTYWEPAKWIARLRANTTSGRPCLLKINMEAGHGGASGRFDFLKEIAMDYAFAIKSTGAPEAGGAF